MPTLKLYKMPNGRVYQFADGRVPANAVPVKAEKAETKAVKKPRNKSKQTENK